MGNMVMTKLRVYVLKNKTNFPLHVFVRPFLTWIFIETLELELFKAGRVVYRRKCRWLLPLACCVTSHSHLRTHSTLLHSHLPIKCPILTLGQLSIPHSLRSHSLSPLLSHIPSHLGKTLLGILLFIPKSPVVSVWLWKLLLRSTVQNTWQSMM